MPASRKGISRKYSSELIDEYIERHKETLEILSRPDWVDAINQGLKASEKGETVRVAKKEIWEILLTKPAERVYDKTGKSIRQRLDNCFEDLEQNPLYGNNIKPLTGQLKGLLRYRDGDWRVIYSLLKGTMKVEIIAILPRGDAYK